MNQPPYPVVRLKPKLDSSAIRYGAPWVFANELVTDRRTRALDPGAIAVLEDSDRRPIGVVTVNNNSKIIGRILDRNPAAVIDEAWLTHKLTQADGDARPSVFQTFLSFNPTPRQTVCPVLSLIVLAILP